LTFDITHRIHITHISGIYKPAGLNEGNLVAIMLDIGSQAVQDVNKGLALGNGRTASLCMGNR
jgi:hypothetical protein